MNARQQTRVGITLPAKTRGVGSPARASPGGRDSFARRTSMNVTLSSARTELPVRMRSMDFAASVHLDLQVSILMQPRCRSRSVMSGREE